MGGLGAASLIRSFTNPQHPLHPCPKFKRITKLLSLLDFGADMGRSRKVCELATTEEDQKIDWEPSKRALHRLCSYAHAGGGIPANHSPYALTQDPRTLIPFLVVCKDLGLCSSTTASFARGLPSSLCGRRNAAQLITASLIVFRRG